jgi:hypothetical protein
MRPTLSSFFDKNIKTVDTKNKGHTDSDFFKIRKGSLNLKLLEILKYQNY